MATRGDHHPHGLSFFNLNLFKIKRVSFSFKSFNWCRLTYVAPVDCLQSRGTTIKVQEAVQWCLLLSKVLLTVLSEAADSSCQVFWVLLSSFLSPLVKFSESSCQVLWVLLSSVLFVTISLHHTIGCHNNNISATGRNGFMYFCYRL